MLGQEWVLIWCNVQVDDPNGVLVTIERKSLNFKTWVRIWVTMWGLLRLEEH